MKFKTFLQLLLIYTFSFILFSCGGGASSTNGSVALTLDKASVGTGSTFTANVTYVSPSGKPLNNLNVTVISDDPSIIPNGSGSTDTTGSSKIILQPRLVKGTKTTVNLVAVVDGIHSSSVPITVNVPSMSFIPLADSTFAAAGAINSIVRIVSGNLQAILVDSLGNPIQNQDITLSVDTISNQRSGDQVVFFPPLLAPISAPPGTITVKTDSAGKAIFPAAIDIVTPSVAGGSHVISVVWRATTIINGYNAVPITFEITGNTLTTVTN